MCILISTKITSRWGGWIRDLVVVATGAQVRLFRLGAARPVGVRWAAPTHSVRWERASCGAKKGV